MASVAQYQISKNKDHTVLSNYQSMSAKWALKSWWNSSERGWKYQNTSTEMMKLKSVTFTCCVGHSNGHKFAASGGTANPVYGGGVEFSCDIYMFNNKGKYAGKQYINVGSITIPNLSVFNCYSGGYGRTNTTDPSKTGFGNPKYYNEAAGKDSSGVSYGAPGRPLTARILTFNQDVSVAPGYSAIAIVHPVQWFDSRNSMLVFSNASEDMHADVEPEPQGTYVWRYTEQKQWVKDRQPFRYTSAGNWEVMEVHEW